MRTKDSAKVSVSNCVSVTTQELPFLSFNTGNERTAALHASLEEHLVHF